MKKRARLLASIWLACGQAALAMCCPRDGI